MALNEGNSLYWKAGIETAGLQRDALLVQSIIRGMAGSIAGINPFAAMGIAAGLSFSAMSREAYKFSKDFDATMKEVATISKEVENNFAEVSESILGISRNGPEGAVSLAKGYYEIISAGITDEAKALDVLRASTDLANGSLTNTAVSADAVTTIMNNYGDEVESAYNVTDAMFTSVKLGKTRMEELAPSITNVAGLARNAGLSITELMAAFGEGTKTMKTEEFTTGLRGFLNAVISPSEDAKRISKELGFEFTNEALRVKGLNGFLQELIEKTQMSTSVLAKLFPEVRGLNGVFALARDNGKGLVNTMGEFNNTAGATVKAVDIMNTKTQNQWKILWNNMLAAMKPTGDYLNGVINKALTETNELIRIQASSKEFRQNQVAEKGFKTVFSGSNIDRLADARNREDAIPFLEKTLAPQFDVQTIGKDYGKEYKFSKDQWRDLMDTAIKYKNAAGDVAKQQEILNKFVFIGMQAFQGYSKEVKKASEPSSTIKPGNLNADEILAAAKAREEAQKEAARQTEEDAKKQEKILEDAAIESALLHEKAVEEAKKADEDYNEWRIKNSEGALQNEITSLEYEMKANDEATNFKLGLIQKLEERKQQLNDLAIKNEKKQNDLILQDYRNFSVKKLSAYRETLTTEIKLAGLSEERRKMLEKEIQSVDMSITDKKTQNIKDIGSVFRELGDLAGNFNSELAESLNTLGDMVLQAADLKEAFNNKNIAMQFSGVFGIASTAIGLLNSVFRGSGKDDYAAKLEKLNKQTERQIELLNELTGIQIVQGLKSIVDTIEKRVDVIDAKIADQKKQIAIDMLVNRSAVEADQKRLEQYEADRLDAESEIADYERRIKETLTGTTTESIADSITDGFMSGLNAADNFAKSFEDLMKTAIINSFKASFLTKYLTPFYDQFAALSEGGLTASEMKSLGDNLKQIIAFGEVDWKQLETIAATAGVSLTDTQSNNVSSLSGAISSMSEETAGLLAGQFNAVRMNTLEMKTILGDIKTPVLGLYSINSSMLNVLNGIADTNAETAKNTRRLNSIDAKLGLIVGRNISMRSVGGN